MSQEELAVRTSEPVNEDGAAEKFLIILRWVHRHASKEIKDDINTAIAHADLVLRRDKPRTRNLPSQDTLPEFTDKIEHALADETAAKQTYARLSKLLTEFKRIKKLEGSDTMFPSEESLTTMFSGNATYIEIMRIVHFAFWQLLMRMAPAQ